MPTSRIRSNAEGQTCLFMSERCIVATNFIYHDAELAAIRPILEKHLRSLHAPLNHSLGIGYLVGILSTPAFDDPEYRFEALVAEIRALRLTGPVHLTMLADCNKQQFYFACCCHDLRHQEAPEPAA